MRGMNICCMYARASIYTEWMGVYLHIMIANNLCEFDHKNNLKTQFPLCPSEQSHYACHTVISYPTIGLCALNRFPKYWSSTLCEDFMQEWDLLLRKKKVINNEQSKIKPDFKCKKCELFTHYYSFINLTHQAVST